MRPIPSSLKPLIYTRCVLFRWLLRYTVVFLGIVLLCPGSFAQKVSIFQGKIDISAHRTYSWLPGRALTRAGLVDNPPSTSIIQREVDAQLRAKGYQRVEAGGELTISFMAAQQVGLQVESIDGGTDVHWHIGQIPVQGRYYGTGTLAISLADPTLDKTVFLAICSDTLKKPKEVEKKITRAVAKAFRKFPAAQVSQVGTLEGTEWVLRETVGAAVEGIQFTLRFADAGRVSGNGGCNHFSGTYKVDGDSLTFSPLVTTRRTCPDPRMRQEERLLKALMSVQRFAVTQLELVLSVRGAEQPLRFSHSVAGDRGP